MGIIWDRKLLMFFSLTTELKFSLVFCIMITYMGFMPPFKTGKGKGHMVNV